MQFICALMGDSQNEGNSTVFVAEKSYAEERKATGSTI